MQKYNFDGRSARRIVRTVRGWEAFRNKGGQRAPTGRPPRPDEGWRAFKNDSGETMPGHAIFRLDAPEYDDLGNEILVAKKPDTTFARVYAINSPVPVEDGHYSGMCKLVSEASILALVDESLDPGTSVGPKPGEWGLFAGYPEIAIVTGMRSEGSPLGYLAYVKFGGTIQSLMAKADGTTAYEATGTFSVWYGEGVFTGDTTMNISGVVNRGPETASGDKGAIGFANGTPVFYKECSGA